MLIRFGQYDSAIMKSSPLLVSLVLLAGCLGFFFPLLTVQVPLFGTQDFSGYDLVHRPEAFDRTAKAIDQGTAGAPQERGGEAPAAADSVMPWSVENLQLVPLEVFFAFGLSLAAFVLCVFERRIARFAAALGAVLAVAAVLHLTVANSDLHSWMSQKLASAPKDDNPFAGLIAGMASMALAAFQIKAGVGLYGLAASLTLASIFLFGQAGEARDQNYEQEIDGSESILRDPVVLAGGALVVGVALFWFFVFNKPKPRALTPLAQSSLAPAPEEAKRLIARIRNNHYQIQLGASDDDQLVTIQFLNGEARADDSVYTIDTTKVAFGDLDGDGKLDALVIVTESGGGSGGFESLAGILDVRGVQTLTRGQELGDRVAIRAMSIRQGVARITFLKQGPDDPMCCPTQKTTSAFRLRNNRFIAAR